jgi:hypothetical protein
VTDVVAALADLRDSLAWPADHADITSRAVASLAPRRRPRWPYAAAAAVVAIGVGVPVAAHVLSIGGVRITLTGEVPSDIGGELLLGRPAALREDAPRPPSLGDPAAAFEGRPAGGYTEVWPGPVLVTQFPGSLDEDLIEKRVFDGGAIERVLVDGDEAYWISGPHGFLYLDDAGHPQEDTIRLSGSALVWTRDGITYRLESDRSLAESIALAESMF